MPGYYIPASPEKINMSFHLFTQKNQMQAQIIKWNITNLKLAIKSSHFDFKGNTKVIIPGFTTTIFTPWVIVSS